MDESIIDISRIEAIYQFNSFKSEEILQKDRFGFHDKEDNSGLWYFPSFFNHSCLPNVARIFMGDVMFLFAATDINQNEQLTLQYFPFDKIMNRRDSLETC